jgi:hypothetical protein
MLSSMDERARRMGIIDTKLAQAAAIFGALTVVKLFPEIMDMNIGWFILLTALCAIRPFNTFFGHR